MGFLDRLLSAFHLDESERVKLKRRVAEGEKLFVEERRADRRRPVDPHWPDKLPEGVEDDRRRQQPTFGKKGSATARQRT